MAGDAPALPRLAAALAALIPPAEREAIVGDLLEDAAERRLAGLARVLHLCGECATIAAGFTFLRVRTACSIEPARELAAGLAMDGGRALRSIRLTSPLTMTRVVLFCCAVGVLALAAEVLVGTLFTAAGLRD